jgi:hypothetical protein
MFYADMVRKESPERKNKRCLTPFHSQLLERCHVRDCYSGYPESLKFLGNLRQPDYDSTDESGTPQDVPTIN